MEIGYIVRRFAVFLLVIVVASTLIFFLPRLSGEDPVLRKLLEEATRGGYVPPDLEAYVEAYRKELGLDQPLIVQYWNYLSNLARLDLGISITNFPTPVISLIQDRILWTFFLGGLATLVGFSLGTMTGALIAWNKGGGYLKYMLTPFIGFAPIPYYLLGLLMIYLLTYLVSAFPPYGGYSAGEWLFKDWTDIAFVADVLYHAFLPGISIALASMGFWALGMRGMMITTQGQDYMVFAQAKGLSANRIFFQYAMRNSLLPQTTALALALGTIVSGLVLVEIVFSYPGLGGLLTQSISQSDFPTLQGVMFIVIGGVALSTFVLDMVYPLIDPRIKYSN